MGTDDDTAASRLGALATHFRQYPVTGAEGHSYISSAPRTAATSPAAPVNLTVVDHITASLREVVDHTLATNPAPSPLPARVEAVYGWYVENTRHAPEAVQQRRDTVIYRQRLEHALAAGDRSVVRPHRCPACRTFGLFWRPELARAVCTNGECLTRDGLSQKWTLGKLAYEHIAAMSEKAVRDCAT